jgi:leucyl-tRNA synthetase
MDPTPPTPPGDDVPPFRYTAALANQIEARWQDRWEQQRLFCTPNPGEPGFDPGRTKKYILDMFPYPSGAGLHVGHPLGYIATDIYARYLRMTGHNVLHAMGFDAFGLPAEQFALQTNTHPRLTTERNIATMRRQLRRLGLAHDPRRSVSTTDERFYRWTQWIFLQIYNAWFDPEQRRARPIEELRRQFEQGRRPTPDGRPWSRLSRAERAALLDEHRLAYLAEVPVNWCPMLGTVLANEEVTSEGRSERGNFPVYRRPLRQWMMRITAYADRLLEDLELLDWPEPVKLMQRHWIGRSEGAFIDFECSTRRLRVFTTRPDTLFGATFMVLAPDHPAVDQIVADRYGDAPAAPALRAAFPGAEDLLSAGATPRRMLEAYRAFLRARPAPAEPLAAAPRAAQPAGAPEAAAKTGVWLGAYAVNPGDGRRLPVFVADYVLMGYGTGAIMGVPAHDERDFDFAARFGLPVVPVVRPEGAEPRASGDAPACFSGEGVSVNSPPTEGLPTAEARRVMTAHLERMGRGRAAVQYRLRDWLFSRQRYWGEPFPIVFDEEGLAHPVPESQLPVVLPPLENFQPESSEDPDAPVRTPLSRAESWVWTTLDLGDGRGPRRVRRETNTMPNWAGSCWYYLRYLDPENDRALVDPRVERYWMTTLRPDATPHAGGVDLYVGGVEHAVLHLLYARFWHKILFDLGHVSTPEPFARLFSQGYIQAYAYTDARGVYVPADEVVEGEPVEVEVGTITLPSGLVEPVKRTSRHRWNGQPVFQEYGKMGKSLKNAVAPDDVCAQYGADTLRIYEMSMGPLEASKPWNTRDIAGAHRFLQRVWRLLTDERTGASRVGDDPPDPALLRLLHKTIAAVRRDMEALGFNTAIARLIELTNELTRTYGERGRIPRALAEPLVLMLAPFAPHIGEELWSRLAHPRSLAYEPYPVADPALAADPQVEIPVSVNGKVRATIQVAPGLDKAQLEAAALADPRVQSLLEGRTLRRLVAVPGRMVNLVV